MSVRLLISRLDGLLDRWSVCHNFLKLESYTSIAPIGAMAQYLYWGFSKQFQIILYKKPPRKYTIFFKVNKRN